MHCYYSSMLSPTQRLTETLDMSFDSSPAHRAISNRYNFAKCPQKQDDFISNLHKSNKDNNSSISKQKEKE